MGIAADAEAVNLGWSGGGLVFDCPIADGIAFGVGLASSADGPATEDQIWGLGVAEQEHCGQHPVAGVLQVYAAHFLGGRFYAATETNDGIGGR